MHDTITAGLFLHHSFLLKRMLLNLLHTCSNTEAKSVSNWAQKEFTTFVAQPVTKVILSHQVRPNVRCSYTFCFCNIQVTFESVVLKHFQSGPL